MERIDVMLWYGGCLDFSFDLPQYIDGNSKLIQMDFDHIAYFELVDYVMETNEYENRDFYMYGMDADNGDFKLFRDDKDVLELAIKAKNWSEPFIEVFVQHKPIMSEHKAHHCSQPSKPEAQPSTQPIKPKSSSQPIKRQAQPKKLVPKPRKKVVHVKVGRASGKCFTTPEVPRSGSTSAVKQVVEEPVHEASWAFDIDKETNLKEVEKESVKEEEVFGKHSDKEAVLDQDSEDSEDSDYNEESSCDDDEDCYSDEEDVLEELVGLDSDTEDFEWKQSQEAIKQATKDEEAATKKILEECIKENEEEGNLHETHDAGSAHVEGYSSYEESDGDIATPGDSEEDDVRGKKFRETAPSVSAQTNWKKFVWKVGTRFASRDAFKEAVRRYAVANGRNLFIAKSDSKQQGRLVIKCVAGCPFYLFCSMHTGKECYMIKSVKNHHTCQRNMIMKCSNCGARGHNKRKCTEKEKTTEGGSAPKRQKKSTKKALKQSTQEATQQSTYEATQQSTLEATQQSTKEATQKSTQKGTKSSQKGINKSSQKGKRKTNQG
ncbi:putative transcription factor interactor and regulator CCHC(Zn) family [Helianthus annuus]|nr:putative transcription factor interactor and regulator CCHC(Zn) family [Helianthus annuus]KAJ0459871.1 putative transcription factor interactor and regulator CCHC(Zn) family [Helianthus annuus]